MEIERRTDFEYRGWQVHIEPDGSAHASAMHADLYYQGKYKCRVALTSKLDPACACWALDSKARDFIDEWSMKPRGSGPHPLLHEL
jgi:hypothetical protein